MTGHSFLGVSESAAFAKKFVAPLAVSPLNCSLVPPR
jgi:hypothetical protein